MDEDSAMTERRSRYPLRLPHVRPGWVREDAVYFITICAEPRGRNTLCRPSVAEGIWSSVTKYAERGNWWPVLFLLMPDHLHALLTFPRCESIAQRIGAWKRFTSRTLGVVWQRDFFEHRLRHDESWCEKSAYIEHNPIRAGLVTSTEAWPYVWRMNMPG